MVSKQAEAEHELTVLENVSGPSDFAQPITKKEFPPGELLFYFDSILIKPTLRL